MTAVAKTSAGGPASARTQDAGRGVASALDGRDPPTDQATATDPVKLDRGSADTVRRIRWARGFTMEECAFALGVTVFDYRAKERGGAAFSRSEFDQLLRLLEISASDLERWVSACSGK